MVGGPSHRLGSCEGGGTFSLALAFIDQSASGSENPQTRTVYILLGGRQAAPCPWARPGRRSKCLVVLGAAPGKQSPVCSLFVPLLSIPHGMRHPDRAQSHTESTQARAQCSAALLLFVGFISRALQSDELPGHSKPGRREGSRAIFMGGGGSSRRSLSLRHSNARLGVI